MKKQKALHHPYSTAKEPSPPDPNRLKHAPSRRRYTHIHLEITRKELGVRRKKRTPHHHQHSKLATSKIEEKNIDLFFKKERKGNK